MKSVLLLGGYGGFGAGIAKRLAADGYRVLVAGRSLAKAQAFCAAHPQLSLQPVKCDRSRDLVETIAQHTPFLVVDAAGPFQGNGYAVPRTCIRAGCHYVDIADARDFVCDIGALNDDARRAGVSVISGASSVPALSCAVTDRLGATLDNVTQIEIALSASNRAAAGASVVDSMLSYAGRPIRVWRGRAWRIATGWQEIGSVTFRLGERRALRRLVALCDVPDLDLLPERYPGRPAVRFRAGTEFALHNLLLWLLSWPVRWGWLRDLRGLGWIGLRLLKVTRGLGGDRSAMSVVVKGKKSGRSVTREWTLLAERGDGPWVPCLAAPIIARKLASGIAAGARTATGVISLAEFKEAFADYALFTETRDVSRRPLYARIMGERFDLLPDAVRIMHDVAGESVASGRASVTRGTNLLARAIGWMFGFPPANDDVAVSVWMREDKNGEHWVRDFGGHRFASRLSQVDGWLVESFGPLRFAMALDVEANGLSMRYRRFSFGPIRLPLALAPRGVPSERSVDGCFVFDVPIRLPLIGLLVHYRGWLVPDIR